MFQPWSEAYEYKATQFKLNPQKENYLYYVQKYICKIYIYIYIYIYII